MLAHVLMGDGDGAYRLFSMLNPVNHARTPEEVAQYKVEPYVIAADVYSHPQHTGRGGWTWCTGSASWLYHVGVEYVLGLKLHGDHFTVEPCIPSHWPGYSMVYTRGETSYRISVEKGAGQTSQVQKVELDGSPLPDCKVPLVDDRQRHEVRVVMGNG